MGPLRPRLSISIWLTGLLWKGVRAFALPSCFARSSLAYLLACSAGSAELGGQRGQQHQGTDGHSCKRSQQNRPGSQVFGITRQRVPLG